MMKVSTKNYRVYTRDQFVTGFLEGEEINIIVNHYITVWWRKKSSPFREAGTLNKKIIDSTTYNPQAKNYIRRFKRRRTKCQSGSWRQSQKKQMYLSLNLQSIRGYGQKVLEPLPSVMLGIF
jgi:hypothetical protein